MASLIGQGVAALAPQMMCFHSDLVDGSQCLLQPGSHFLLSEVLVHVDDPQCCSVYVFSWPECTLVLKKSIAIRQKCKPSASFILSDTVIGPDIVLSFICLFIPLFFSVCEPLTGSS